MNGQTPSYRAHEGQLAALTVSSDILPAAISVSPAQIPDLKAGEALVLDKMHCLTEGELLSISSQIERPSENMIAPGVSKQESTDSLDADSVLLPLNSADDDALQGSAEDERSTTFANPADDSLTTLSSSAGHRKVSSDGAYDLASPNLVGGLSLTSKSTTGAEGVEPALAHVTASPAEDSEEQCGPTLPSPKPHPFVVEPLPLSPDEHPPVCTMNKDCPVVEVRPILVAVDMHWG